MVFDLTAAVVQFSGLLALGVTLATLGVLVVLWEVGALIEKRRGKHLPRHPPKTKTPKLLAPTATGAGFTGWSFPLRRNRAPAAFLPGFGDGPTANVFGDCFGGAAAAKKGAAAAPEQVYAPERGRWGVGSFAYYAGWRKSARYQIPPAPRDLAGVHPPPPFFFWSLGSRPGATLEGFFQEKNLAKAENAPKAFLLRRLWWG
jgi:hypothetical protein